MSTLIENGPYQFLNKDPTDRPTRELSEKLLTLKRSRYLSEAVDNKITSRHKQPPRIYGLPKIRKADVPLRPIVSCVNTFAYDLSTYLANILSLLTVKSEYTVTNSAHFVSTVISILAVHSVICSLGGPLSHGSPVVVFSDRGHPRFWNFYSTISVDVVRVKSYMNCLFDPERVVIRAMNVARCTSKKTYARQN